ncbi:hypothetical protein [Vibrio nigripulchritudo]|uniref:hypothetical protein n=1 Tax=Vibrio nigripulchritudo TaxID=28173 RepID=UPI0003B21192|nr:hypothetical protein [Vibrio nigripulchritudo]CCN69756.1 hypothetical protein VIBNISFn118_150010 [Vibrio nigripulchritudo SFn118]
MSNPLGAQVVISLTLNREEGRVDYSINTYEGESSGINQLAEKLQQSVIEALPKCATPIGVES